MSDPHSRPEDLPTFAAGTASGGDGLPTPSENAKTFADGAQTFAGATVAEAVGVAAPLPATFGRYRILRLIGEGGMGAVYEAEQDQPRRTVALKVIKPGLASPELLRRFAQESQALGRLQHPGIATIAVNQGKPEAAVAPLVEAIDAARRAGQEELSLTAILAGVYALQKKFDDAVTTLAPVLARPAAQNDLVPNVLAFALRSLATGLRNEKRFAEAEPYFARLLPIVLVSPGEAAGQTRIDLFLLGDTYASQRKYPESERSFAQLLDVQRRTSVPESVAGFSVASSLGWAQLRQGRLADAERTFRDALAGLTRVAPDSWERFNVASMLGATLSAQRRFSDAEPLLTSGYEGMDTRKPANANAASRFTRPEAGAAILQLYADWGNTARRAEWEERLKN